MSLNIHCSAYYLKIGNRVIDKITDEFNPPRYWFRVRVSAKGASHKQVSGQITNLWWQSCRKVKDFEPLNFLWVNEPSQMGGSEQVIKHYFKPDITAGHYEMAGLIHSKLPMKPVDPNIPVPEDNIPDEQLPEVEVDQSQNEPRHMIKRRHFPYGIYFIEVAVSDDKGQKANKSFKVWAFRDPSKCKIRSTRFYERFLLKIKLLLPAV